MKKISLIIALFFSVLTCLAQNDYFGFKAGGTASFFSGSSAVINDMSFGYHAGITGIGRLGSNLFLQTDILYSTAGAQEFFTEVDDALAVTPNTNLSVNLSYVNFAFQLKYFTQPELSFFLGPQINLLMNSDLGGMEGEDFYNPWDFGVSGGATYYLINSANPILQNLSITAKYYYGISSVTRDDAFNLKNQFAQISIGYILFRQE